MYEIARNSKRIGPHSSSSEVLMLSNIREIQGQYYHTCHKYYSCQWL